MTPAQMVSSILSSDVTRLGERVARAESLILSVVTGRVENPASIHRIKRKARVADGSKSILEKEGK